MAAAAAGPNVVRIWLGSGFQPCVTTIVGLAGSMGSQTLAPQE
jgi:hypothetical protein